MNVSLYGGFAKTSFRGMAIYRSAYWLGLVAQWLSYGVTFITLFIVVDNFNVLGGWKSEEVLFLYAMNLLSYALAALFFFGPCTGLSGKIRSGEFDAALTKPVSPLVHEMLNGFNPGYVSHITLSVAVMVVAVRRLHVAFNFPFVLTLLAMLFGAALVQAALLVFASAWAFFFINGNPFMGMIWSFKSFINYPIPIYPVVIQILLTFLPLAFMNYYPSAILLNRTENMLFPPLLGYLTPLVGITAFVLSVAFWNFALSRYQSTGT
ncbi:MAG: ABC transporter permease [Treponema sp.]|nr:ABC transporter permease [Treponema sp.]